ncbi:MAG: hypothetical protein U0271_34525 [Polyangiaceae bacterium]
MFERGGSRGGALMHPALWVCVVALGLGACGRASARGPGSSSSLASSSGAPLVTAAPTNEPPQNPASTIFGRRAAVVGQRYKLTRAEGMQALMQLNVAGRASNGKIDEASLRERQIEILGVDADGRETKVRVSYAEDEHIPAKTVSPVRGKTYIVTADQDRLTATTGEGKPITPEEGTVLAIDFEHLGKGEPFHEAIPLTPLMPGDRIPALEAAVESSLERAYPKSAHADAKNVKVTFAGREGSGAAEVGVFDISLDLTWDAEPVRMQARATGQARHRIADRRFVAGTLDSSLTIVPGSTLPAGSATGSGAAQVAEEATYYSE